VAPYVVTGAVLAVILHRYPVRDIATEMREGHALRMVPLGLTLPFVLWLPYAVYDRVVMRGAIGPVPLFDVLRAKAACSVLLTLGYFLGGGGYAVWIARTTRVGAARAAGTVLFIMASDLTAVCAVAGASMWLGGAEVPHALRNTATTIFFVQVALMLVGPHGAWLRMPAIFEPWRLVPRRWSLLQIAGRIVNITVLTSFTWMAMRVFGLQVPAAAAAMYMPMILLVASLPVNVAGLGAAQAAWLLFLPWASGAQLLAFQALWHVMSGVGILVRGLPFVRRVVREVEEGA
jgi:hypothetical protein